MNQPTLPDCNPKAALKQQGKILLGLLAGLAFFLSYTGLILLFAWSVTTYDTAANIAGFAITNILLPALLTTLVIGIAGPILYAIFKPSIHLGLCLLLQRQTNHRQSP